MGRPNDILLDYYFKQVDYLKAGAVFKIDFSKETSHQMILINNHIISSFICRFSTIYSENKFAGFDQIVNNVTSNYASINYFRSLITSNILIFEDDLVEFSFNGVNFVQDNLKELDIYEKKTNFLFGFLGKLQTIKGKAEVRFKLINSGKKREEFESIISTEQTYLEYGKESIKRVSQMFNMKEFNEKILLERLIYFNLNYPATTNISDPLIRSKIVSSIKEFPHFEDLLFISSFLNKMMSDRNNVLLNKMILDSYEIDKKRLELQSQELSKGLIYET